MIDTLDDGEKVDNFIWDKQAGFGDLFDDTLELANFYANIKIADANTRQERIQITVKTWWNQLREIIK